MLINYKNDLKDIMLKELTNILNKRFDKIDYNLFDIGLDKIVKIISKESFNLNDLNDYNKFPIPEEIYNSVMGEVIRCITMESKMRSEIVHSIEKYSEKYLGVKALTINQKLEQLYLN